MVTTLMAVALPFCCCNGRFVSQAFGAMAAATHAVAHAQDHADSAHHAEHSKPVRGCCPSSPSENSTPCDDDGPCDCDQHKQIKKLPEIPTTLDLSATAVVLLPSIGFTPLAPEPPVIARLGAEAIPRPRTSLLRLHCALIV
jgi:hypothetical protein